MRYLFLILILFLSGCKVQKNSSKEKEDRDKITNTDTIVDKESTSKTITERKVEGGYINTPIIPEDERERDSNGLIKDLIQEIKDGGLTKTVHYKPNGEVDVDCRLAEMFERIQEENVQRDNSIISIMENLEERLVKKENEKTEGVTSLVLLYFFLGMSLFISIVMFVFFKMIKAQVLKV